MIALSALCCAEWHAGAEDRTIELFGSLFASWADLAVTATVARTASARVVALLPMIIASWAAFCLLPRDWMAEYRFATAFIVWETPPSSGPVPSGDYVLRTAVPSDAALERARVRAHRRIDDTRPIPFPRDRMTASSPR